MIFDLLSNIKMYKGLNPNFDIAIDYILENDFTSVSCGRHEVKGDDVYYNVVESSLCDSNNSFECHKKYMDIHIDIIGKERILFSEYDKLVPYEEYNSAGDYELLNGKQTSEVICDAGHFVVCMPGEPHMPCVGLKECDDLIKKVIFKVKMF